MRKDRANAGRSEHSWIKHDLFRKPVRAQSFAYRVRFPDARMLLVDANSGDGEGVARTDDLFRHPSEASAEMLNKIAAAAGADLCLCEKVKSRRLKLMERFGSSAVVLAKHEEVPALVLAGKYNYVLWLSDPCGYAGHGLEPMKQTARLCPRSDFVIALNIGAIDRLNGVNPDDPWWGGTRQKWIPTEIAKPVWWRDLLGKKQVSSSDVIEQSRGFKFKILVVSNFLAQASRKRPFKVIEKEE